jgi:autotransporter-associated beta strand protein
VDLTHANLSNVNFYGAVLTDVDLTQAYGANAHFVGAAITRSKFITANLPNANFFDASLPDTDFTQATLTNADFTWTNLSSTNFHQANLSSANFTYASSFSSGADFTQANLSGANFSYAVFPYSNLAQANLTNANLFDADLRLSSLVGANLHHADLTYANLDYADLTNADLTGSNLNMAYSCYYANFKGANLSGTNLTYVNFNNSNLTGTNFTDAVVNASSFNNRTSNGFTPEQLYSTASYKVKDLTMISLAGNNMSGWNFAGQKLVYANFTNSTLTGADFSGADVRDTGLYLNEVGAIATNAIRNDGSIQGLDLSGGRTLVVRDYMADIYKYFWMPTNHPIPIYVTNSMSMGTNGTLQIDLDQYDWYSKISFHSGIPVALGGSLNLAFVDGVDIKGQLGRTIGLFDWSGVSPTGAFGVSSAYEWDVSKLYSSGEVTLLAPRRADTSWTGSKNSKWNDPANWSAGVPGSGSVIKFDAANPSHQPIIQNISSNLSLRGIIFQAGAGEHVLGGPLLRLQGDVPTIACASAGDQYIGNPLELAADTNFVVTGSGAITLAGEISGSGSFVKLGSGKVILENSAAHQGQTLIQDGTLALDTTGQIENSTIKNDATFQILDGIHTVGSITGAGTTQIDFGSLTVGSISQGVLTIGAGATLTIAPVPGGPLGGDLNLQPVPEPLTIVFLFAGLLSLLARRLYARKRFWKD